MERERGSGLASATSSATPRCWHLLSIASARPRRQRGFHSWGIPRRSSFARGRCTARVFSRPERFEIYEVADEGLYLTGTSGGGAGRSGTWARSSRPTSYRSATPRSRPTSAARRAPPGGTRVDVPRPSVQQGRDVLVRPPGRLGEEHDRLVAITEESPRSSAFPTGAQHRRRELSSAAAKRIDIEAWFLSRAATARSRRRRTRPTTKPAGSESATERTWRHRVRPHAERDRAAYGPRVLAISGRTSAATCPDWRVLPRGARRASGPTGLGYFPDPGGVPERTNGAVLKPLAASASLVAPKSLPPPLTRGLRRPPLDRQARRARGRCPTRFGSPDCRPHHPRELVLDQALDRPPQRARAELRVEALSREDLTASSVNSTSIRCARRRRAGRSSSSSRDVRELLVGQRPEDDDLVDPVDELRPEALRRTSISSPSAPRSRLRSARTPGSGRRRGSRS